jgi:hypothetical protein
LSYQILLSSKCCEVLDSIIASFGGFRQDEEFIFPYKFYWNNAKGGVFMRVRHDPRPTGATRTGERKRGKRNTLSLRLGVSVAIFLAVLGAKVWFPGPTAPAMSVLGEVLTSNTSLSQVTQALGQAAAGEGELLDVFRALFTGVQSGDRDGLSSRHWQWECRFLSSPQEQAPTHVFPDGTQPMPQWLDNGRSDL